MDSKLLRRAAAFSFIVCIAALSISFYGNAVKAAPQYQLKEPQFKPRKPATRRPVKAYEDDVLLVSPAMKTDLGSNSDSKKKKPKDAKAGTSSQDEKDEVAEALKEIHGTVIRSFGEGEDLVLVVKTEKGKLSETEAKLTKDKKHFAAVQRNYYGELPQTTEPPVNDPYFPEQWYLPYMNIPASLPYAQGDGIVIADIDSGTANVTELSGRVLQAYDAYFDTVGPSPVRSSHGTLVCTGGFAATNNGIGLASGAGHSYVFPLIDSTPEYGNYTNEELTLRCLTYLKKNGTKIGVKIVNIEVQVSEPERSYFNPRVHPTMHNLCKALYNKGMIVVVPMGNYGFFDPNPRISYMVGVSGINPDLTLFDYGYPGAVSTYGNPVWFTAAGDSVRAQDVDGGFVSTGGTSLAAPLLISQIAMVWSVFPKMTNAQILQIMAASCPPMPANLMQYYGYGIPDTYKAIGLVKSKMPARYR
jgi:hypothetical protein